MTIAAFDIIPTDDLFNDLFNVVKRPLDPLNENFETVGFETIYFVHNLGSLAIFMSICPLLMIINLFFKMFKKSRAMTKASIKIETHVYWNATIRIFLEAYTIIAVCAMIQTTEL